MAERPTEGVVPRPEESRSPGETPRDAGTPISLAETGPWPAAAEAKSSATPGARPDGRYTVERLHARGGLGQVQVARDERLRRRVALKEIRPDRRAADARRRFLNEAEITGQLEHPGIVPVYALETDAAGEPYYVMRFIQGRTLHEAIRAYHRDPTVLAFRDLLQRFVSVCQTVAYAHSRGVIHRDLKPANVMLGDYGETLVVDWGLARVVGVGGQETGVRGPGSGIRSQESGGSGLGEQLSGLCADPCLLTPDPSDLTQAGRALGTPGYMAPEQARGEWDRVGPAADLFSLGAILFELLTGRGPYTGRDGAAVLARAQAADYPPPRRVRAEVPAPLEAVCLQAMAPDPARRYPTAAALADDARRWLADEPVTAFAEPWPIRAGRWARKHRGTVATAGAVLVTATLGLAVGLVLVSAEKNRTEEARQREQEQRIAASTQADLARQSEHEAKEYEADTRAVLGFVENHILAAARPKGRKGGLGRDVKLRDAIIGSLPAVAQAFADQPLVEARLRRTLGQTLLDLGDARSAAAQFERVRAIRTEVWGPNHVATLDAMHDLATSYHTLGRHAEALKLREQVLAGYRRALGPDNPSTLAGMHNLANSYHALARLTEACKLREETLAARKRLLGPEDRDTLVTMNNLAISYAALGRLPDACKLNEEALAAQRRVLGVEDPDTLMTMTNLANSYEIVGRRGDALRLREETLATQRRVLGPEHPETLMTLNNLANSYDAAGRPADALRLREETLAVQKRVFGPDHPGTLMAMNNLAVSYAAVGRKAEACKLNEEALAAYRRVLGPEHPDTLRSLYNLSFSYYTLERYADALKLLEETLTVRLRQFGPEHADTLASRWGVADCLVKLGRGAEAIPHIDECVARAPGKHVDPQMIPELLDLRLRYFQQAGNAAGCRATALMWEKLNRSDSQSLYRAAAYRAVAAAVGSKTLGTDDDRLARDDANRAMVWLTRAVATGYKDRARMGQDRDLDVLRGRADFQKLLKSLPEEARRGG